MCEQCLPVFEDWAWENYVPLVRALLAVREVQKSFANSINPIHPTGAHSALDIDGWLTGSRENLMFLIGLSTERNWSDAERMANREGTRAREDSLLYKIRDVEYVKQILKEAGQTARIIEREDSFKIILEHGSLDIPTSDESKH